MITAAFRPALRAASWLTVFTVILVAWSAMFVMARMSGVDVLGRPTGMNMMPMTTFGSLFPMWAVMMAAMMLPTMVPALGTYDRLMRSADGTRAGWAGVLLGYGTVWTGFAALIAAAQVALIRLGLVDGLGAATTGWLTAGVLCAAGVFQFSRTKQACHGKCHAPMTFYLTRWRTGFTGGVGMGLRMGGYCVVCCWGFMALGFTGGVMSLLWMGLATLFMVFEKLPDIGHRLIRPAGAVLIIAGLAVALRTFIL